MDSVNTLIHKGKEKRQGYTSGRTAKVKNHKPIPHMFTSKITNTVIYALFPLFLYQENTYEGRYGKFNISASISHILQRDV